jgi:DNA-binding response OmpR family regulator
MSRGPASAAARVVLVVNDDPLVRAYTARVLAEAGYVVFTAEDREEALALARTLDDQLGLVVVGSVSWQTFRTALALGSPVTRG